MVKRWNLYQTLQSHLELYWLCLAQLVATYWWRCRWRRWRRLGATPGRGNVPIETETWECWQWRAASWVPSAPPLPPTVRRTAARWMDGNSSYWTGTPVFGSPEDTQTNTPEECCAHLLWTTRPQTPLSPYCPGTLPSSPGNLRWCQEVESLSVDGEQCIWRSEPSCTEWCCPPSLATPLFESKHQQVTWSTQLTSNQSLFPFNITCQWEA